MGPDAQPYKTIHTGPAGRHGRSGSARVCHCPWRPRRDRSRGIEPKAAGRRAHGGDSAGPRRRRNHRLSVADVSRLVERPALPVNPSTSTISRPHGFGSDPMPRARPSSTRSNCLEHARTRVEANGFESTATVARRLNLLPWSGQFRFRPRRHSPPSPSTCTPPRTLGIAGLGSVTTTSPTRPRIDRESVVRATAPAGVPGSSSGCAGGGG